MDRKIVSIQPSIEVKENQPRMLQIFPKAVQLPQTNQTTLMENGQARVITLPSFKRVEPLVVYQEQSGLNEWMTKGPLSNSGSQQRPVVFVGGASFANLQRHAWIQENRHLVVPARSLMKTLFSLYAEHRQPAHLVFDEKDGASALSSFLQKIYSDSALTFLRWVPITQFNARADGHPLIDPIKVLAVNGSPFRRANVSRKMGNTRHMIETEIARYWTGDFYQSEIVNLANDVKECQACGHHQAACKPECRIDDQVSELIPKVLDTDVLILGSPVYADGPTPRMLAFLTRLSGQTKFNRFAYIGKRGVSLAAAWCSGTKSTIMKLNNHLEMLGFTVGGRSSRELIDLWPDGKIRGGVPAQWEWPS